MWKTTLMIVILLMFLGCNKSNDNDQTQVRLNHTTGLKWQVPDGWIEEPPTSPMRKAQFRLPRVEGDPEDANLVLYYFQGQGGSVQANIQRWYGQFKQPDGRPTHEVARVKTQTVNGLKQTIVDLSGTYLFKMTPMDPASTPKPNSRMLAAIIETHSGPWFVKLVGPEKTVTRWEESFHQFLRSIKE